jgi:four helix bundle protein
MEGCMVEYTKLRKINRGYMQLDVWVKSVELYKLITKIVYEESRIDFKVRSQIVDSALSVPSNIAEGYSRRSIKEYIQFLYIALASMSETFTRSIGLTEVGLMTEKQFREIDVLHYEIENKLIKLVESLEKKKLSGTWMDNMGAK